MLEKRPYSALSEYGQYFIPLKRKTPPGRGLCLVDLYELGVSLHPLFSFLAVHFLVDVPVFGDPFVAFVLRIENVNHRAVEFVEAHADAVGIISCVVVAISGHFGVLSLPFR